MTVAFLILALLVQTANSARIGNVVGAAEVIGRQGTAAAQVGRQHDRWRSTHTLGGSYLALSTESGAILQLGPDSRLR